MIEAEAIEWQRKWRGSYLMTISSPLYRLVRLLLRRGQIQSDSDTRSYQSYMRL